MEVKTWTEEGPLPEQKRWKVSKREEKRYFEVESDSLFYILYIILLQRRIRRTRLWEEKYRTRAPW